jgi:rhodanese-related sulfurtransferase
MIRKLSTDQLDDLMQRHEDFLLVDVLPRDHFERDHIEGSRSAPVDDANFVNSVASAVAGKKNKKVVVYCASEQCDASTRAAGALESAGFTNVFDYKGGLEAWHDSHDEPAGASQSTDARSTTASSPSRGSARFQAGTQPTSKGTSTQSKGPGTQDAPIEE